MLTSLHIAGYRSIRNLLHQPGRIETFVGPNGCGKSNLYRGLQLLARSAEGGLARALADEGGIAAALSASAPAAVTKMTLGCRLDAWEYEVEIGLAPVGPQTSFRLDPWVRRERLLLHTDGSRPVDLLDRHGARTVVRDDNGNRVNLPHGLPRGETALGELRDPSRFPELAALREELRGWRFYHQFRTDAGSPLRRTQVGTFTPVLAHDGRDLAAALQSIREHTAPCSGAGTGSRATLDEHFERAFPGSTLFVREDNGRFDLMVMMPGVMRALGTADLSDGTLRFLCLLAALSSPRPAKLIVLNEPENSLHPSVLPALAELIVASSADSQILLTTHSRQLADAVTAANGRLAIELELREGETLRRGLGRYE